MDSVEHCFGASVQLAELEKELWVSIDAKNLEESEKQNLKFDSERESHVLRYTKHFLHQV